ncbi:AAA family ATPase [Aquabacterium sp. J223]|uniref:AAA family ATPase n=1 Tax=Aquabacterium sp. J223 TaxID=2898431 RepID=UPI0021AD6FBF|nr:AAA family ATPase [Aquabacterium sp. J223]UUX95392.1 AAA family ATPase [Aquabacterium sp. J223]
MKTLNLALANCYGIRKLEAILDYSKSPTVSIYAPNGAMKSSLANTFQDIAHGKESKDRVFLDRVTTRSVTDEVGAKFPAEGIVVLRPYEEAPGQNEETATLLVNQTLRKEYEALHADIYAARTAFLKAVKAQSKSKRDIDKEISTTFTAGSDQFYVALNRIKDELAEQPDAPFASVPYEVVMDEKVLAFLATGDFKTAIDDYVKKYNELLAASKYFKKGTFNYYNAATVARQLKENGFFEAKHTVSLNGEDRVEITSEEQLEELIKQEKEKITSDAGLRKKFDALEKQIQKNATLRDFEAYVQQHEELLPELANLPAFKEKLWKSYIKSHYELYLALIAKVQAAAARSKEIQEQAAREGTQWQAVIDIFNDRFVVPFRLVAINKVEVMLGQEAVLRLGFMFKDGEQEIQVGREALLQTLSTGERKAFYVLNMLFDIEVRKQGGKETLVVVDDIADSFDYKNKYAIVQYLADLAEDPRFKLLILTHNFDFYRTIQSRGLVQRNNCFMVSKTAEGVRLQEAVGIKNVFVNLWKPNFHADRRKKIGCIPFMRNLIEYTRGDRDADYSLLTSLLHWKAGSDRITVADLDGVYFRLFGAAAQSPDQAESVLNMIDVEARACLQADDGINFENKVVMSIATRLKAERFMAAKINDDTWLATISANQTPALLKRYRDSFSGEAENLRVLQRVMLMTPENVHLNSFMYEPILDMSDQHLRRLYQDVLGMA